jgi:hypothetical protein
MYNTCNDMSNTKFKPGDTVEVVSVEEHITETKNWIREAGIALGQKLHVKEYNSEWHRIRVWGYMFWHPAEKFKLTRSGAGQIDNDLK